MFITLYDALQMHNDSHMSFVIGKSVFLVSDQV